MEFIIKGYWILLHSFLICDIGISHPWLMIILICFYFSKGVFWVKRTLWSKTPINLLFGNYLTIYKFFRFSSQVISLFSLSLWEVFIHLKVWFVLKRFKSDKSLLIFYISKLFDISPCLIMIIFEDWWIMRLLYDYMMYLI